MIQQIDEYGRILETEDSLLEKIYRGETEFKGSGAEVEKFNHFCRVYDMLDDIILPLDPIHETPEQFHKNRQNEWMLPPEYIELDIENAVKSLCTTPEELQRVEYEMEVFKALDLLGVLKAVKYAIDVIDTNGLVRGVGRGSSVASLCLYLLGVHFIHPLEHELDFSEFLSLDE